MTSDLHNLCSKVCVKVRLGRYVLTLKLICFRHEYYIILHIQETHPRYGGSTKFKSCWGDFSELKNTTVERCSAVDFITGQPSHCRT